ncbi:MAG: hypothetical protein Q7T55_00070 [Solirubrobacteraceae bacterium]|nr:hypothetical protein [Solirubrobacteraceae bacterium]
MARPSKTAPPTTGGLPSPEAIVEREAGQRRVAIYSAVGVAIATALAVIVENVINASVPDQTTSTLIDTFGAAARGASLPASYFTAVGEWKLDNVLWTAASSLLRALAFLLMIPPALFIMRGARERGGSLFKQLEYLLIAGAIIMAAGPLAIAIGEPSIYHAARDAGFTPGDIRQAVLDSNLILLRVPILLGSLLIGIPLAFGSMQAYRAGLLPPILGFMGVLVGILFVVPLDASGLLRAFWFSAVAFVISGRASGGYAEAWATGIPVPPAPRQPPAPREKKAKKEKAVK